MEIKLNNKVALITGASRGIGRAIANFYAKSGANLIIHYNKAKDKAEELRDSLEGDHMIFSADMADPDSLDSMVKEAIKKFGKIDILVNNAGIYQEFDALELDYDNFRTHFQETININLNGPANLSYLVAREMKKNKSGKIINITSRGAFRGEPTSWPYGAAKAGLNSLGQSMAKNLAPHNIKVFTIAPGFVKTDMSEYILNSPKGTEIKAQSPLNRAADPDEIARLATFLAADGTDYMTGCIIDINGASYLRT